MCSPKRDFNKIKQLSLLSFMKRALKLMITTHKGSQATNNNNNSKRGHNGQLAKWLCTSRRRRRRWWWPARDEAAGTVASAKQLPNWLQLWIMSNGIIATNSRHKQLPLSLSLSLLSHLSLSLGGISLGQPRLGFVGGFWWRARKAGSNKFYALHSIQFVSDRYVDTDTS